MPVLLIPLAFFFIYGSIASYLKKTEKESARMAFILSVLAIAFIIDFSTELLSLLNGITKSNLIIAWLLFSISTFLTWWRCGKYIPHFKLQGDKFTQQLIAATGIILLVTLITSLASYPNNWDSMTYHLARVMHWIQNKNTNHYPTQINRQITQPPLSEYFFLHVKLLSGYDPLLNFVQWIFFAGNIIAVSLIAKECGASSRQQVLASFFCATIPMAILQSSSTQNDLVTSFFVSSATLFLLHFYRQNNLPSILCFFLSAALAILTKGTAIIFIAPLILLLITLLLIKRNWKPIVWFIAGFICLLILISPYYARNMQTFNHPLGMDYGLTNQHPGIAPMLSNAAKNIGMQLRTPVPVINQIFTNSIASFNKLIGVDTNSPQYNWSYSPPFEVDYFSTHEDLAGNFFHTLFLIVAVVVMLSLKKLRYNKLLILLLSLQIITFLFFSFVLKWQVWASRLQLPLFIAGSVLLAFAAEELPRRIRNAIAVTFFLFSTLFLFLNWSRPWLMEENIFNTAPENQYFKNRPAVFQPYKQISLIIQRDHATKAGFICSGDSWEYPFWVLNRNIDGFELENILPENDSKKLEDEKSFSEFTPDVLIVNRENMRNMNQLQYHGTTYNKFYTNGIWSLFKK